MQENSVLYIYSGKSILFSADEEMPFKCDYNFYYLTGINKENMILEIKKLNGVMQDALYIQNFDPVLAKWIGPRMLADEAKEISNVMLIKDYDQFDAGYHTVCGQLRSFMDTTMYLDLYHVNPSHDFTCAHHLAKQIQSYYPSIVIKDIYPVLTKMRLIKDDTEINEIKKAIEITKAGIEKMWQQVKNCKDERVLEGYFMLGLRENGCRDVAFPSIIASGASATTLHYVDNDAPLKEDTLVLCDLGATSNVYKADITRTFPVNGRFTPRQKEIYDVVLQGQKKVIENAVVGKTLAELNQILVDFYKETLPSIGLTKDVSEYYYHGVSHMLGLNTHDVDFIRGTTKLEKGMVITVEPGLYVADEEIGIRIEDDILIGDEPINLSASILKETQDIEDFMNA